MDLMFCGTATDIANENKKAELMLIRRATASV